MTDPAPAPEPVEVAADELAAAEAYWHDVSRRQVGSTRYWGLPLVMAEYDRMRAELTSLRRQAGISERAANGFYAHAAAMELQRDTARADLARALPVVEAAGAVVSWWEKWCPSAPPPEFADLLDALARAYRAAREPRTGEGG